MKKLLIAVSISVALGAAQAWAGPACEGTIVDANGNPKAGACDCTDPAAGDMPGAPEGPSGCIVLSGPPGYLCAGGGPSGGCIGGEGDPGSAFVCVDASGSIVPDCSEAECRAAAEAGCGG